MTNFLRKIILLILFFLINLYRYGIKFVLVNEGCRYDPSCSLYMQEALKIHGIRRGLFLGIKRISRCHPWHITTVSLYDPVPLTCKSPRKEISWTQKKEI